MIPFSRGADYFKDDRIGKFEISIKPFVEISRDSDFFFFDAQVQKALDRLIASIYELDSAQMKYFINKHRSGFLRFVKDVHLEGRTDPACSLQRLNIAADRVERNYRDFVSLARERLERT